MPPKKKTAVIDPGPFSWECIDGETITMPPLTKLDAELDVLDEFAPEMASPNPLLMLRANRRFLMASLPDDDGDQLRHIKRAAEFTDFLSAWAEHSGITLGELAASPNS